MLKLSASERNQDASCWQEQGPWGETGNSRVSWYHIAKGERRAPATTLFEQNNTNFISPQTNESLVFLFLFTLIHMLLIDSFYSSLFLIQE